MAKPSGAEPRRTKPSRRTLIAYDNINNKLIHKKATHLVVSNDPLYNSVKRNFPRGLSRTTLLTVKFCHSRLDLEGSNLDVPLVASCNPLSDVAIREMLPHGASGCRSTPLSYRMGSIQAMKMPAIIIIK